MFRLVCPVAERDYSGSVVSSESKGGIFYRGFGGRGGMYRATFYQARRAQFAAPD